jgi:hypothetical protein
MPHKLASPDQMHSSNAESLAFDSKRHDEGSSGATKPFLPRVNKGDTIKCVCVL